jgi:hypothetical protein
VNIICWANWQSKVIKKKKDLLSRMRWGSGLETTLKIDVALGRPRKGICGSLKKERQRSPLIRFSVFFDLLSLFFVWKSFGSIFIVDFLFFYDEIQFNKKKNEPLLYFFLKVMIMTTIEKNNKNDLLKVWSMIMLISFEIRNSKKCHWWWNCK